MALRIGDEAPDFTAETTQGKINFHQWIGNGWAILFSHPKDFTPVCTTELGYLAGLKPVFDKRRCEILGLSVDSVADPEKWAKDIEETQGQDGIIVPSVTDAEAKEKCPERWKAATLRLNSPPVFMVSCQPRFQMPSGIRSFNAASFGTRRVAADRGGKQARSDAPTRDRAASATRLPNTQKISFGLMSSLRSSAPLRLAVKLSQIEQQDLRPFGIG